MRFLIACIFLVFTFNSKAVNYESYFEFDEVSFKGSFEKGIEAEDYLLIGNNLNQFQFQENVPITVKKLAAAPWIYDGDYEILGLKPFAFSLLTTCVGGIVLGGSTFIAGPIAWLLVYIDSDHDKEATRSALNGCLVGNGIVVFFIATFVTVSFSLNGI
jgi:hypothetical protein